MFAVILGGVVIAAGGGFILYKAVAPFRRIWAGDARLALRLPARYGQVKARAYLVYLLWFVPGTAGMVLLGVMLIWKALHPPMSDAVGVPTAVLCGLALLASPMHAIVNLTNRPRFLVPPPYRDQPGSIATARLRRARKKANLPPTSHRVEIIEFPADGDGPQWLYAQCSELECPWMYMVTRRHPSYAEAEGEVWENARMHSDNVVRWDGEPDA